MDRLLEQAAIIGIASGIAMLAITLGALILNFFVALQARPKVRAAWTVGIPFAAVAAYMAFTGPPGFEYVWPLGAFFGAIPVYLYRLHQYNYAWVESIDDLPDGVVAAEDDWRSGLVYLFIFLGSVALLAFLRYLRETVFG